MERTRWREPEIVLDPDLEEQAELSEISPTEFGAKK
jgi:hypothetical protein